MFRRVEGTLARDRTLGGRVRPWRAGRADLRDPRRPRQHRAADGRRLVTDILGAGDAFGDLTLGSSSASIEEAEALTDLQLLAIDSGYAAGLARCDSKWALRLIEAAAGRVNQSVERLQELSYRDVEARVAAAVLRYAFDGESTAHASHQEIGDIAGTYRETVTRVLNELQSRGVVRLGRCRIEIADRRALEAIARR